MKEEEFVYSHLFYSMVTGANKCRFCDVEMTDLEVMRYLDEKESKRNENRAFSNAISFGGNFL